MCPRDKSEESDECEIKIPHVSNPDRFLNHSLIILPIVYSLLKLVHNSESKLIHISKNHLYQFGYFFWQLLRTFCIVLISTI